jgi:hypothetical protein
MSPIVPNEAERVEIENLPILILRDAHVIEDEEAIGVESFIRQPHVNAPGDTPGVPSSSTTSVFATQSIPPETGPFPATTVDATESILPGTERSPEERNSELDIRDVILGPVSFHLLNPTDDDSLISKTADDVANIAIADLLRVANGGVTSKDPPQFDQRPEPKPNRYLNFSNILFFIMNTFSVFKNLIFIITLGVPT